MSTHVLENPRHCLFTASDALLWTGFYLLCITSAVVIWPVYLARNFVRLMRGPTLFALGIYLIGVDQSTKWYAWWQLQGPEGKITVVDGFFDLTYVTNTGAAFGLFKGYTSAFVIMALLTIVIIVGYLSMIGDGEKLVRVALVLIMAGAIGNVIDRVFLGHVIDFISVHWHEKHFPVFNFADTIINVGVGLIILDVVLDLVGGGPCEAAATPG